MTTVNVQEAQSGLSRQVDAIERGLEQEIFIIHNGHPAARLVPMGSPSQGPRIGIAKGSLQVPETIDDENETVADQFGGVGP